ATANARSPARRLLSLTAPWPNIDVYAVHRRRVLNDLDLTLQSIWLDRNIIIDILLHGPIARIDEELFYYRLPPASQENYERRAHQHFGEAAIPASNAGNGNPWAGYDFATAAFRQLATVLVSRAPLSGSERAQCFLALASVLMRQGWFTRDELYATMPELKRAIGDRDIASSLRHGLRVLTLSPTLPFTGGARKALALLRRRGAPPQQ
ncbi:MAG TPA: hypothetical protein VHB97_25035, partial [Polyangia bacterium]|nr:hypothetical protein [Polyangia bacterium]